MFIKLGHNFRNPIQKRKRELYINIYMIFTLIISIYFSFVQTVMEKMALNFIRLLYKPTVFVDLSFL